MSTDVLETSDCVECPCSHRGFEGGTIALGGEVST